MRKQIATMSLAIVGLLTTQALAGGFMGDYAESGETYDHNKTTAVIDGVPVYEISNDTAGQMSYYDWRQHFDWKSTGVSDYKY
jgi:hypothetical protein